MAELGWTDFLLPSRGHYYDGKLPDGRVQLKPMGAKQHTLLLQQGGGTIGKIDAIVDTCCKLPAGITHKDLLLTDRLAILLAIRTKSFGPIYSFRWRCAECGKHTHSTVNIAFELDEKTPAEADREPIEVTLPDAGNLLQVRFLRGRDEEAAMRNAKRVQMSSNDNLDPSHLGRIALQLVSKDGEAFENAVVKHRFVESLTARDLIVLENAVAKQEPGVDLTLVLDCSQCDASNRMAMPFTGEFFRPRDLGDGGPGDAGDEPVLPRVPRERVHPRRRGQHDAG